MDGQQESISSVVDVSRHENYGQQEEVPQHINNSADGTVTFWDRVVQHGAREAGGGQPSRSANQSISEISGLEALELRLDSIGEHDRASRPFVSGQLGRSSSDS